MGYNKKELYYNKNFTIFLFLLFIIFIIITIIKFNFIGLTGYVISESLVENDQRLINYESLGANPKVSFNNTIGYDSDKNLYFFTYSDSNLRIYYTIDPSVKEILRAIKTNVSFNGSQEAFTISTGGVKVIVNDKTYNTWDFYLLDKSILSQTINNNTISIKSKYTDSDGDEFFIDTDFRIKGKTLIVNVSSNNSLITSIQYGKITDNNNLHTIPNITYNSNFLKTIIRINNVYSSIYNNFNISRSSNLNYNSPSVNSTTSISYNSDVKYLSNSEGKFNKFNELIYITVSNDFYDNFPNIINPASPFISYLKNMTILDFWLGTSVSATTKNYTQRLNRYGFKDLLINELVVPSDWGSVITNLSGYNYDTVSYNVYIDCYSNVNHNPSHVECYNDDWIQEDEEGNLIEAYESPVYGQSYALRYDRHEYIAENSEVTRKDAGQKGTFADTIAANLPWRYVDKDGEINPGANSSYSFNINYQLIVLKYLHDLYDGPILTEGVNPLYWIGYIDAIEGSSSFEDSEKDEVVVDLDLLQFHPKTLIYSAYYRRFFDEANLNISWKGITSNKYDKYMATNIAFGHLSFIDSPIPSLHNISDNLVVRYYYLTKALQKEYALYNATEIKYYSNSEWKSLSDAIRNDYDFVNAQVKVVYNNELNVYVNRHSSNNLIVNYNSEDYTIPPSGWLAYNDNDGFFEFSGLQNGNRIDIVESNDYTYIDSRDAIETIQVKPKNYKVSKFDFTQGSLVVNSTSSTFNYVQTQQPLRLDALSGLVSTTETLVIDGSITQQTQTNETGSGSSGSSGGGGGGSGGGGGGSGGSSSNYPILQDTETTPSFVNPNSELNNLVNNEEEKQEEVQVNENIEKTNINLGNFLSFVGKVVTLEPLSQDEKKFIPFAILLLSIIGIIIFYSFKK